MAVNEITNHKVAIKILNKRKIKLQGVFEKVKREIKVLRRFNHPHIIKHFEFIDTSSDIFIVLEYAEKGELFDLIQRKEKVCRPLAFGIIIRPRTSFPPGAPSTSPRRTPHRKKSTDRF